MVIFAISSYKIELSLVFNTLDILASPYLTCTRGEFCRDQSEALAHQIESDVKAIVYQRRAHRQPL